MFWKKRKETDEYDYTDDFESIFEEYEEDEPLTKNDKHNSSPSKENERDHLEKSDETVQTTNESDCDDETNDKDDTNEVVEDGSNESEGEKGTHEDNENDLEDEDEDKNDIEDEETIKQRKNKLKAITGGLVGAFLLGLGIFAYQPIMNYLIAPKVLANAVDEAYALDGEQMQKNDATLNEIVMNDDEKMKELFGFEDVELLGTFNPSLTIQKKNVVGGIYIPKANINLPILYGSTNKNLNVGATTMKPTQAMGEGNYALAGHNARNRSILFAGLRYLKIEEKPKVYVTDKNKLYEYTLTSSEIVKPSKIEVIDDVEDKRMITLVTCYAWDGSNRLILQGELTSVIDYAEADTSIQKVFNKL